MIPAGPTSRLTPPSVGGLSVLAGSLVGLVVLISTAALGGNTSTIAVIAGLGTAVGLVVVVGRQFVSVPVLLGGLVLVMLYVPARRYVFAINLPFGLAPYRALILFIVAVSFVVLLRNPSFGIRGGIAGWPFLLLIVAVMGPRC